MWPLETKMPAFTALSYLDMWRVSMCLRKGEAPSDPRLAAAAVDLAEGYRRQGRVKAALSLWLPLFSIVWLGYLSFSAATTGDAWLLTFFAPAFPLGIASLLLDPGRRPQSMARALEASRRILASSDWKPSSPQLAIDDGPVIVAGWYVDPNSGAKQRLWDGQSDLLGPSYPGGPGRGGPGRLATAPVQGQ